MLVSAQPLLDAYIAAPVASPASSSSPAAASPSVPKVLDAAVLRRLGKTLTQPVLWVELPVVASGSSLPPISGLSDDEKVAIDELLHDECREMLPSIGRPIGTTAH